MRRLMLELDVPGEPYSAADQVKLALRNAAVHYEHWHKIDNLFCIVVETTLDDEQLDDLFPRVTTRPRLTRVLNL
jgi:hypothetical protein